MKRVIVITIAWVLTSCVCYAAEGRSKPPLRWLPMDEKGWTALSPSPDTRLIYVSHSLGDDSAGRIYGTGDPHVGGNPFKPAGQVRPYKTLRAGLAKARDGHPDWVLLKRGDSWDETLGSPPNGRSGKEPLVIAAYGDGAKRPQLRLRGKQSGLRFDIHRGFHDVAIVGLEFYAPGKDPDSPEFNTTSGVKSGISVFISGKLGATGRRLLIEDCRLRFCGASFTVARDRQGGPTPAVEQLVFRRNLVLDNYSRTSHCQGTYATGVSILLEENVYDHNGWLVQERGNRKNRGGATMFNHNTYFCDCRDVVFRGNMFLRASSIGNKWTANSGPASARNLVVDDNLYVEGEIGISAGGNKAGPLRFKNMAVTNNVFLHLGRGRPTLRNLGWGIDVADWDGGIVAGNVLVQRKGDGIGNVHSLSVKASEQNGRCRGVSLKDNVFYGAPVHFENPKGLEDIAFAKNKVVMPELDGAVIRAAERLSGCAFSDNAYFAKHAAANWFRIGRENMAFGEWAAAAHEKRSTAQQIRFTDPERTIETYMAHLGLGPTFEAFIAEVRGQSKANWKPEFTAAAVNEWIRAGFDTTRTAVSDD